MLTAEQKTKIETWVKEQQELTKDVYEFFEAEVNGKIIPVMIHLHRSESPSGEYEPPWGANIEGLKMYLLEELIPEDLTPDEEDELKEEIINYANNFARNQLSQIDWIPRDAFGGTLTIATFEPCTPKEWKQVIKICIKEFWGYGNS